MSRRSLVLRFMGLIALAVAMILLENGFWRDIAPDGSDQRAARDVAIAYARALRDGDTAAARARAVDDPVNLRYVDAELRTFAAIRAFGETLAARFGSKEGQPDPYYDLGMTSRWADSMRLPRLAVRILGDTAVLCERGSEPGDEDAILQLKRGAGEWKVWEVTPDTDILTEAMQTEMLEAENARADAMKRIARDVAAGQFRTAGEARVKLREALLELSSRGRPLPKPGE